MNNSTTAAAAASTAAAAEALLSWGAVAATGGFDLEEALKAPWNSDRQIADADSLVAGMPTVSFDGGDNEGIICPVCREGVATTAAPGKRVPCCGHVYHADCLAAWLHHRDSCPLCRFTISRLQ
ncbi:unnamed protein product [Linum tenue]|uniref:RING-type E3 ubiquitin transferase n=1 Tax=Linum tenue TaxID=586396 RepID=A0AAV0QD46_9ROSI|nr:unnamed protein product [Linum tenue]